MLTNTQEYEAAKQLANSIEQTQFALKTPMGWQEQNSLYYELIKAIEQYEYEYDV